MIIYNTTFHISDKVYAGFLKWIKEKHIPQMTASGCFSDARVSKVITEDAQEGTSVSVQLTAESMDAVAEWNEQHGDLFKMEIASLFSEEVLYFCTFMEII